ncbi:transmembrane protein [Achlya hypogyna]|uniref:Transmembrane protein n=1 Tax=Achlya hypogyna TaxID=1202772 RepID=A0A1V9YWK2_ACHHY|nr:transmembrane protein [Achlya hypogyna]
MDGGKDHGFMEATTPEARPLQKQTSSFSFNVSESSGPKRRIISRGKSTISRQLSKPEEEAHGKLRINMGKRRAVGAEARSRSEFKMNLQLAVRTACGVLIASMFQTKNPNVDRTETHPKYWALFPNWYILGGISYVAVACIFSCGKNIGATIREMFQQVAGVGMAFVFNCILFMAYTPRVFNSLDEVNAAIADGTLLKIDKSFSGTPYYVNNTDLFTVLPFVMAFNAIILALPFETSTKKFAMGNNLYFALTIVSPNDFNDASTLKRLGDPFYSADNILKNLFVYMWLGVLGAFVAFLVLWIPYPIFAIRQLQKETLSAADTIQELLNLIVDTYCFRNKDVENMNFLKIKLQRKFDLAMAKKETMAALLNDVWWEQSVGLHYLLKFQKSVTKPYIELYGSLIDNLRAMNQAIHLERYERLHVLFMQKLQREVYVVQLKSTAVLHEISAEIHLSHKDMNLTQMDSLEVQMENLLQHFRTTQTKIYKTKEPTTGDVEGNIPLNLFLFSLQSFCTTMMEFQSKLNKKTHKTGSRVANFIKKSLRAFVDPTKYSKLKLITGLKVWCAILVGCFLSVYVFAYSATTATTIAYVMGNHIGGSFSITLNRVGGVVAGSIIPSVILFFICSYGCTSQAVVIAVSNLFLFLWVTFSLYIKWKGGFESYAGLVSAYVAAGVLLKGCACSSTTTAPVSSYSNLAQMSLGIILFIMVELVFWPQSAIGLLRENVQKHMKLIQTSFSTLFEQNLRSEGAVDADTMEEIRAIVETEAPALLAEQKALLREAAFEPLLWRPPFSQQKYERVLDGCQRLLNNTLILYKLVTWFQFRKANPRLVPGPRRLSIEPSALLVRRSIERGSLAELEVNATPKEAWAFSTKELGAAIHDTFDTLHALFGEDFRYADADQTALFMQMKEAFRLADTDCSGEIDADEVKTMLQHIFAQSGALKVEAIDDYVADFMNIVDADKSGKVSFEEFMEALENGLKLEVEVFQHRAPQPEEPALHLHRTVLAPIQETSVTVNVLDVIPILSPGDGAAPANSSAPIDEDAMCRAHDILDVETFSLLEAAATMRRSYAAWLMESDRFANVSMEELLLLNCLISGVSGIARNLALLEEMTVQH